jgi:hypothetical protein
MSEQAPLVYSSAHDKLVQDIIRGINQQIKLDMKLAFFFRAHISD